MGVIRAATGLGNPVSLTVTNTPAITALFGALKSNQVSLTALQSSNGTVVVNPASGVFTNGDTVTLTAVPAANYVFTAWGGDASGASNPLALVLDTNKVVAASFAVAPTTNLALVFQTVAQIAGTLTFTWSTVPEQTYQVQYTTNFSQTDWSNPDSAILATNTTMSDSDSIASGPAQRWYRVALLP